MYVDALTMSAVADELVGLLVGGRVQEILAVDALGLGFEVYANGRRRYLYMSAHPQTARIHLTSGRLRRGVDAASPLLLLLRKWVRDARLMSVSQPAFERILTLRFEHPEHGVCELIFECMGRHSNVILVDADMMILECVKRVGADVNRYRVILPRQAYVPPPAQDKLPPNQVTELRLRQIIAAGQPDDPAWKLLVQGMQGVSPLLAREMCHRAWESTSIRCRDIDRLNPLLAVVQELFTPVETGNWQPTVALAGGELEPGTGEATVTCFAPYPLTQFDRWEPADSISEAIERWARAGAISIDTYRVARGRLQAEIDEIIRRVARRWDQLREQMKTMEDVDSLRIAGEMILAYGWNMVPGQSEVVIDLEDGDPTQRIAIDPGLSPAENAGTYFERYQKARRARDEIPPLLERAELELAQLQQWALDLSFAENREEIDQLKADLIEAGYVRGKARRKRQKDEARPLSFTTRDGMVVLVGRNSRQNDNLTFRVARGDDLWFHARSIAGAHVILQTGGREPSAEGIRRAAELAAYYSAGRQDGQVQVDYTPRRHVRRQPGGAPGQVFYRQERALTVAPKP